MPEEIAHFARAIATRSHAIISANLEEAAALARFAHHFAEAFRRVRGA